MPLTNTIFSRGMPCDGSALFHLRENGVVPATGTPADILIAGEIGRLQYWKRRLDTHDSLNAPYDSNEPMVSSTSATLNGLPCTLFKPFASIKYSARNNRPQLPQIKFGDQDGLEGVEDLTEIPRKRIQITKMAMGDALA